MKWKVDNALSRDVERQHLNKILKDIRSTVDALSTNSSSVTEIRVREIVRGATPPPPKPPSFTLTLVGDVSGSADIDGDTTLTTSLDVDVIPEVPPDGAPYWRRFGEWEAVPMSVFAIATLEDAGFVVTSPESEEVLSREFEAEEGELSVINPNGVDGNVKYGLARIELEAGHTIHSLRMVRASSGIAYHPDTSINSDALSVIGIARTSGQVGEQVQVQPFGRLTESSWTWDEGAIYCGNEGVLTQSISNTEWVLRVGRAISPTTIEIDISTPILRN